MTKTALDIITALITNKSLGLEFPQHKEKDGTVSLERIKSNFGFVETAYLQLNGNVATAEQVVEIVDKAIKERDGSALIDIIKEAGKIKQLPPDYMNLTYVIQFKEAGLSLYQPEEPVAVEGKLFDVPEKYRTGVGYPSDKEVIALCHFYLNGIKGYESSASKKTYRNKLFNLLHVYAHLQESVLTEALGTEWVANFKEGNKTFEDFKQAIDMTTQGESLKYTREEQPFIYFQGRVHLNGPCVVHCDSDPNEEIRLLTDIMSNTEDQESVVFTKAIAFIHRSNFQKEIYNFLTSIYEDNEQHRLADNRQRGDIVFHLVGRYMEERRAIAKRRSQTTRYTEQPREPQPTKGNEQMFNSSQQQAIKYLSSIRGMEGFVELLKDGRLAQQLAEQPKVQISGPDGEMLEQLKQIFGDDCVIVPISQGDDISEAIAKAMEENKPAQVKVEPKSEEVETRRAKWAEILGITDPEILDLLTEAVIKDIDKEKTKVVKTPIKHSRHMSFNVLGRDGKPEARYTGVWDESVSQLVVCFQTPDRAHPEHIFTAKFNFFSEAATAFTEMSKGIGVMPIMDVIELAVSAFNGEILSRQMK